MIQVSHTWYMFTLYLQQLHEYFNTGKVYLRLSIYYLQLLKYIPLKVT